jgi:hypothetical protein
VTISLCCLSGGDPPRLAALLELCRDAVDEIVVGLDERVDPAGAARAVELADRVVRVPYASPPGRTLPWLYAQCNAGWVLRLDDDEIPSRALLDALPGLADTSVTHVWLPRRWLFGSEVTYLDALPWVPDFQLRLSVNDPRLVRFPGIRHVPIEVAGPARYSSAPLYHLDLLRPRVERERKVEAYDSERPGMRIAGLAFNHAFYLPELRDAPLQPVPPEDRELVAGAAATAPARSGERPELPSASRSEIDAMWRRREHGGAAELAVWSAPDRLEAGERAQVVLIVRNRGTDVLWPEAVHVVSRWGDGEPGLWTRLPTPVEPSAETLVPVTVEAPDQPGEHCVELDLVHDGIRWFRVPVRVPVDVLPRRRVGILVREETRARGRTLAAAVLAVRPDLEPVLVGATEGDGYAICPGPEQRVTAGLAAGRRKLRSFVAAAGRVRAVRRESGLLEVDALVLAGLEATTLLERWSDLAAALLAADRDAPILVPPPPRHRGLLDRLLLSRLVRTRGVQVGGDESLPDFLARL